jgi:Holliday junction resolvase-like predicted endonuclease
MVIQINKSTRHSKITGDFAESLVLYWLSKHGFECAKVDHTGIDLIARNPVTNELMGISVKSRSRNPGRGDRAVRIEADNFEKLDEACRAFGCVPYFAIVVDADNEIKVFILSKEKLLTKYKLKKGLNWSMKPKNLQEYEKDPEIKIFCLTHEIKSWWT